MAIEVPIKVINKEFLEGIKDVENSLIGVKDGLNDVSEASKKAFSDVGNSAAKPAQEYEKISKSIDQLKLKLQSLKIEQASAIGSIVPDVDSIKKFNSEIVNTTKEIGLLQAKLNKGSKKTTLGDQIKDAFSPDTKKSIDDVSDSIGDLVKPVDGASDSAKKLGDTVGKGLAKGLESVSGGAIKASGGVKELTKSLKSNIYLAIAAAIAFLVKKLVEWSIEAAKISKIQQVLADATNAANESTTSQRVEIESLVTSLKANTTSLEDKEKALERLKKISPEYFANLQIENGGVKGLTASYEAYIIALKEVAKAKFLATKSIELENELDKVTLAIENLEETSTANPITFGLRELEKFNLKKAKTQIIKELKSVNEAIAKETEDNAVSGPLLEDGSFTGTRTPITTPEQANAAALAERERQRLIIEAMKEGVDKQIALEIFRFEDLEARLDKANIDTENAYSEHQTKLLEIKQKFVEELNAFDGDASLISIAIYQETLDNIQALEDGFRSGQGGGLNEDQTIQLFLLRRTAAEKHQEDIEKIRDENIKLGLEYFDEQAELEKNLIIIAESDGTIEAEEIKAAKLLEIDKQKAINKLKFLQGEKDLNAAQIAALEADIAKFNEVITDAGGDIEKEFSIEGAIVGLFNTDDLTEGEIGKAEQAFAEIGSRLTAQFSELNKQRQEAIQDSIDLLDEELDAISDSIDEKEDLLQRELELQAEGKANKADILRGEISDLKANEAQILLEKKKAFEEKKKAQKAQLALDAAAQLAGLVTASVSIFKALAPLSPVGIPLAVGLIATMFGAFAASQSRAAQAINRQKFRKGGSFILEGDSHENGGVAIGQGREAEGGEGVNIFSRTKTRELGQKRLNSAFDMINNASTKEIDFLLSNTGITLSEDLPGALERGELKIKQNMFNASNRVSTVEGDLRDIKKHLMKPKSDKGYLPDGRKFTKKGIKLKVSGKKVLHR